VAGSFLPPVIAELVAKTDEFRADLMKARGEMLATADHGTSSFNKLASVGKAAFFGLGGAVVGFGGLAVKAALEGEASQARLETAIRNTGEQYKTYQGQIDDTASRMAKFGYENDTVNDAIARLIPVTHSTQKAIDLMGLAADVAHGRNISLASATDLLVKVESGHVGLLGRLGIATKDASGHTITAEQAVRKLTDMYGGDAQKAAGTYAGKLEALKAEFANTEEEIGTKVLPVLASLAHGLASTIEWFDHNKAAAYALAAVVGGPLVVAIGAFLVLKVQSALEGIAAAWNLITGAATRAAAAEAAAGEAGAAGAAGTGGLLAGLGGVAPIAGIATVAIGGIAYGLHQNAENARKARQEITDYLNAAAQGAQRAVDPIAYLDARQERLTNDIRKWRTELDKPGGPPKALGDYYLSQEEKKLKGLTELRKQQEQQQTSDHAKALAQQAADTSAAQAKELHAIASQYGAYNAEVLKARGTSAEALKTIEQNVKGAVDATDSAISGFTDVVAHFGDQTKISSGDILKFLTDTVINTRQWASDMKTLANDGIDQGLIQELYAAGPKSEGLVKGVLSTIAKGGKDQLNILIAQARGLEQQANTELSSILIQGQANYIAAQKWFAAHPLEILVAVSGQGAAFVNTRTGQYNAPGGVKKYAQGGVFTSPTFGLFAEAGPEAIVPLRDRRRAMEVMREAGLLGQPTSSPTYAGGEAGWVTNNYVTIDARGSVGLDIDALGRVTADALHRVSKHNGGIRVVALGH